MTCQETLVDHALGLPMTLFWPDKNWAVRVVPVGVNTVQAPLPSGARCCRLGQAIARAFLRHARPRSDRAVRRDRNVVGAEHL